MNLQTVIFIVGFLMVLGCFIYFIRTVSARWSGVLSQQTFDRVERIIIGGIVLGVVGMFQPWLFAGYKYGFLLLLFSTLAFIVWSHITPAATLYGEENFVGVSAGEAVEHEVTAQLEHRPAVNGGSYDHKKTG
jgi:predicted lipid-binding transport protein (Tim44 family)